MPESSSNKNNPQNSKHTNSLRIQIIAGFAILIPVMLVFITVVFNVRMSRAMKQQTADMIHNLNIQIKSNIDGYIDIILGNVDMLIADDEIKEFDPEKDGSDPELVEDINEHINSFALYSYYTDYGVVYSDGVMIGKISDELIKAGGSNLYASLDKTLSKNKNGWTSEFLPGRSGVTCLRRLGEDGIAVATVPSAKMTDGMEEVLFVDGMNIFVADKSLVVISTTDSEVNPGSYLKTQISRLVDRVASSTQIGDKYVVATQQLRNNWYVVTAVPDDDILAPLSATVRYVVIISVIMALIALGYVIYMTHRIIDSVNQTVDKLDVKAQTDLLTGLINKRSFEELVDMTLNNPENNASYALIFMDIDNFKSVNDRCGHDVGDLVLKSFSHTIDTVFRETDIKGRLGGDEFCVLVKMTEVDKDMLVGHVNEVCRRFIEALHRKANSARQSLPAVTSSMGAAIWEGIPEGFEQLYHKADTALYASKKRGKDTWSVYGQGDVNEQITEQ